MPSEKALSEKKVIVAELAEKLKSATAGVLVDYKGIRVDADTRLRSNLRKAGVEYGVVKNTLTALAAREAGLSGLESILNGTTSLAISKSDPVAPAKIISEFAAKNEKFKIKGGFVDGKVLSVEEVKALAELPSKEVLIAKMLGSFNAPISGFVNVLNGNIRGLVVALNAIAEKKQAG